jgi:hypothetical protein
MGKRDVYCVGNVRNIQTPGVEEDFEKVIVHHVVTDLDGRIIDHLFQMGRPTVTGTQADDMIGCRYKKLPFHYEKCTSAI